VLEQGGGKNLALHMQVCPIQAAVPVATIPAMATGLESRANLLVLIVLAISSRWTLASPQALTPLSRQEFTKQLVAAAIERTHHSVRYVSAYVRIPYPDGDVPADTGVCTDEIIRSYRAVGVDLQKEVHEDMVRNFSAYPNQKRWRLDHPDSNIDHRRVPNLMVFFQRKGETLPVTNRAADYAPGDLVTWDLGQGVPHIGILVNQKALLSERYKVVHNIGAGPKMEDVLFNWKITGHYRYLGPKSSQ
jgi:uncharacterized protein YijF (DUF1287 family)